MGDEGEENSVQREGEKSSMVVLTMDDLVRVCVLTAQGALPDLLIYGPNSDLTLGLYGCDSTDFRRALLHLN